MTSNDLISGKEFIFTNEHKCLIAEVSFSKYLDKFGIWFNGQLRTFKTMKGLQNNLKILIAKYDLEPELAV